MNEVTAAGDSAPATGWARVRAVAEPDGAFLLVARMTLFLVIFHGGHGWFFEVPMRILALVGVVWSAALKDALYWVMVTAFLAYGNSLNWDLNDNHHYLINYWCLSIACALLAGRQDRLCDVARVLIGLAMLLAVVWKVLTPSYLDGTMFQFLVLMDSRFAAATLYLSEVTPETLAANRTAWGAMLSSQQALTEVPVQGLASVKALAAGLTWWGLMVEIAIAVLFLVPRWRWAVVLGHVLLLIFLFTTYAVANVIGFGWVLAILGAASCRPEETRTRLWYLAAFIVVLLFAVPFSDRLQDMHDVLRP